MASTYEILARLAQWARHIEAHYWRADALTPREFTARTWPPSAKRWPPGIARSRT
jgi:hypothetical protein